jgi:hypothetical protein
MNTQPYSKFIGSTQTAASRKEKTNTQKPLPNHTNYNISMDVNCTLGKAHRGGDLQLVSAIAMYPIDNQRRLTLDFPTFAKLLALMPAPPKPHRAFQLIALNTAQRWGDLARMEKWQIQGPIVKGTPIAYRTSKTRNDVLNIPMPELC